MGISLGHKINLFEEHPVSIYIQNGQSPSEETVWNRVSVTLLPQQNTQLNLGETSESQDEKIMTPEEGELNEVPTFADSSVENSRDIFEEAKSLFTQGRYDLAIQAFEALRIRGISDEQLIDSYYLLGHAYTRVNQLQRSIACWEACLHSDHVKASMRINLLGFLADAHYTLGNHDDALRYYQSTLALDQFSDDLMVSWVIRVVAILSQKGMVVQAFECLQKGCRYSKASFDTQLYLYKTFISFGDHFLSRGDDLRARQAFLFSIRLPIEKELKTQATLCYIKILSKELLGFLKLAKDSIFDAQIEQQIDSLTERLSSTGDSISSESWPKISHMENLSTVEDEFYVGKLWPCRSLGPDEVKMRQLLECQKEQFNNGEYRTVIVILNEALKEISDHQLIAEIYHLLGHAYMRVRHHKYSITSWEEGLRYANANNNIRACLLGSLGDLGYFVGDFEKALKCYQLALREFIDDPSATAYWLHRITLIFCKKGMIDEAFLHAQSAAAYSTDVSSQLSQSLYNDFIFFMNHYHFIGNNEKARCAVSYIRNLVIDEQLKAQAYLQWVGRIAAESLMWLKFASYDLLDPTAASDISFWTGRFTLISQSLSNFKGLPHC